MKRVLSVRWSLVVVAIVLSFAQVHGAYAQTQYVFANNDEPFPYGASVSIYSVGAAGTLTFKQQVITGGSGIGGGYFGANRLAVLDQNSQQCVYASEAFTGDIVGIAISTLTTTGSFTGSSTDAGTSNGIGLAVNGGYLYASYTDSNTIGTFAIEGGCSLSFLGDTSVSGLQAGVINAIAVHGSMMVVSFTDGSIESFNISSGIPVANGDEQFSSATASSDDATYPNQIDITSDGHFAIFGDTSTSLVVEVSDISSGKLAKTKVYQSSKAISSSNIILSPDGTILYVVNTQGAAVTAYFFNSTNGTLSFGCKSGTIKGQSMQWSYLASAALVSQTGNGSGVYVAEFGATSGIALVNLTTANGSCTLQEASDSPFSNSDSASLLSIGTFPPRSF
jgi:hypothetical protein